MTRPCDHRPDTSTWGDPGHDEYTDGYAKGERARNVGPPRLKMDPVTPFAWGYHDGYYNIDGADDLGQQANT